MLTITREDCGFTGDFTWHIGEPHAYYGGNGIIKASADGDELHLIHALFQNIPFCSQARVNVWQAPWAQFIVDNLPLVNLELRP